MTDVMDIALKYGGFTSLDQVFLSQRLEGLTIKDQMAAITPPPSVVNAYFSEIYQKQGPKEAMAYYFELASVFGWFDQETSFDVENIPFIRLNLSGHAYGLVFVDDNQLAKIFSQEKRPVTPELLVEIAQVFPQYKVYQDGQAIFLQMLDFDEDTADTIELPGQSLLTQVSRLKGNWLKIAGYSLEEIMEVLAHLSLDNQARRYVSFHQRMIMFYLQEVQA